MYQRGKIKLLTPPCASTDEHGSCDEYYEDDHTHKIYDSSAVESEPKERTTPCAYLPHSCNEWVIGGIEEVQTMIDDLQAALVKMKAQAAAETLPF